MMRSWHSHLCAAMIMLLSTGALAQTDERATWMSDWSKEEKALSLNLGIGAVVLGWGFANWDFGTSSPRFQDEGWFGRETDEGGAVRPFAGDIAGQFERSRWTNTCAHRNL